MSQHERRVMGLETEYGFRFEVGDGPVSYRQGATAAEDYLFLGHGIARGGIAIGGGWSQYRPNGARVYLDCGDHPEYATPECIGPRQLVAADKAGELVMAQALEPFLAKVGPLLTAPRATLLKNNLAINGESWGTHE